MSCGCVTYQMSGSCQCGDCPVSVNAPLSGNGTLVSPLGIDFDRINKDEALQIADTISCSPEGVMSLRDSILAAINDCDGNPIAATDGLTTCINLTAAIAAIPPATVQSVTTGPLTIDGSGNLNIDFAQMDAADCAALLAQCELATDTELADALAAIVHPPTDLGTNQNLNGVNISSSTGLNTTIGAANQTQDGVLVGLGDIGDILTVGPAGNQNWAPLSGIVTIVSADADNGISAGTDGGAYLSPTGAVASICSDATAQASLSACLADDMVSTDAGNTLVSAPGDGLLFAPGTDLATNQNLLGVNISSSTGTNTTIGAANQSQDGVLIGLGNVGEVLTVGPAGNQNWTPASSLVSADDTATAICASATAQASLATCLADDFVSTDAGNSLTVGGVDGLLYAPGTDLATNQNLLGVNISSSTGTNTTIGAANQTQDGVLVGLGNVGEVLTVGPAGNQNWLPATSLVTTISSDAGNAISAGTDGGAFLSGDDTVSAICASTTAQTSLATCLVDDLVSADAGNSLVVSGGDGLLHAPGTNLATNQNLLGVNISSSTGTNTTIGPATQVQDGVLLGLGNVGEVLTVGPAGNQNWLPADGLGVTVVSTDANNIISVGTDNGAYLSGAQAATEICANAAAQASLAGCLADDLVSTDAGNIVVVGAGDNRLFAPGTDLATNQNLLGVNISSSTGTNTTIGPATQTQDGVLLGLGNVGEVLTVGPAGNQNWLPVTGLGITVISADANNAISAGTDGGAFLSTAQTVTNICASAADQATLAACLADDLVSTDANNSLVVSAGDGLLHAPGTNLATNQNLFGVNISSSTGTNTTIGPATQTQDGVLLGLGNVGEVLTVGPAGNQNWLPASTAVCDGTLAERASVVACLLSTDAGNDAVQGTDGLLHVTGGGIGISPDANNAIVGDVNGDVYVRAATGAEVGVNNPTAPAYPTIAQVDAWLDRGLEFDDAAISGHSTPADRAVLASSNATVDAASAAAIASNGADNTGPRSIVSGNNNTNSGTGTFVNGALNDVSMSRALVTGFSNDMGGDANVVVGGNNTGTNPQFSVIGGLGNTVNNTTSSAVFGDDNIVDGGRALVTGSSNRLPAGVTGAILGGAFTEAVRDYTLTLGFAGAGPISTANRTIELIATSGNIDISGVLSTAVVFPGFGEYFLNPDNIPRGRFAHTDDGMNARLATEKDDVWIGITRKELAMSAGGGIDPNNSKWVLDAYGDRIFDLEEIEVEVDFGPVQEEVDSNGNVEAVRQREPGKQYVEKNGRVFQINFEAIETPRRNPAYDDKKQVPKIGIECLGRSVVDVDGTVSVGDYVRPGPEGRGVKSETPTSARVVAFRDENLALVWVTPDAKH